jgi:membrane protein required for colicin V production
METAASMGIDIACIVAGLLFAALGYRSGFLVQLVRLLALGVAFVVARVVAGPLGSVVAGGLGLSIMAAKSLSFGCVFFAVWIALAAVAAALARRGRAGSQTFSFIDRGLGALLGGAKGVIATYLVVCVLAVLAPTIQDRYPSFRLDLPGSVLGREVLRSNVVEKALPWARALANLVRILREPTQLAHAELDPSFRTVLDHPSAAFLREPQVQAAVLAGDWTVLIEDGRVFELLKDPAAIEALNRIEFGSSDPAPPDPEPKIDYPDRF